MDIDFSNGTIDGKRWMAGEVYVSKSKKVWVDTRTGEGVWEIINHLKSFINYQASKLSFQGYSNEDLVQEIYLIALDGISNYNINKNANISTFLQNHIKNRIINLCKFMSEKHKIATFNRNKVVKVKCPECKAFFKGNLDMKTYTCDKCRFKDFSKSKSWRIYNIPVREINMSAITPTSSNPSKTDNVFESSDRSIYLDYQFSNNFDLELINSHDFLSYINTLDKKTVQLIKLIFEGYTYKEASNAVGIPEKIAFSHVKKVLNKYKKGM